MKKLLALILATIIPSLVWAAPGTGSATLWEKAAYGEIAGVTLINLVGVNPAPTTTFEAVWPESAAYAPLAVAMSTPYCASSDQNADIAAGTGANTLTVKGVNTSFAPFSETVTMHASDGRTSVSLTTTNVLFINSIEVATAGSGGTNAGIIQCGTGTNTAGDPAVTHAYLPAGSATAISAAGAGGGNITSSFMYAVPADYTLLCKNIRVGSTFATAASAYEAVIDGYTNKSLVWKRYWREMVHNTGTNPSDDPSLIKFPAKTIVIGKLAGTTGSAVGPASMRAECLLISDAWKDTPQDIF